MNGALILGVILVLLIIIIVIVYILIINPAEQAAAVVEDAVPTITQTVQDINTLIAMIDGIGGDNVKEFVGSYLISVCLPVSPACTSDPSQCPPLCDLINNVNITCCDNMNDPLCQSLGLPNPLIPCPIE